MSKKDENLKDKSTFLFDILKRYDHYVATTNFKVGLIMSFLGVTIFGLIIRVLAISPEPAGCNYLYYATVLLSGLTVLFSMLSALNLLRAIFPSNKSKAGGESLIFFGDVAVIDGGVSSYVKKIEDADLEELVEDLSKQIYFVAEIINEKFRVLKVAVNITSYLVIPFLAASLLLILIEGIN